MYPCLVFVRIFCRMNIPPLMRTTKVVLYDMMGIIRLTNTPSNLSILIKHFFCISRPLLVGFSFPFCNQFIFQARCKFASMLSCLFWCQFFIVFVSQGFFYKMNLLFINLPSSFSLYIPQISFC